jgi:hypothetical protein
LRAGPVTNRSSQPSPFQSLAAAPCQVKPVFGGSPYAGSVAPTPAGTATSENRSTEESCESSFVTLKEVNCQGPDSAFCTYVSAVARAHSRRPCLSRPQTKKAIVALPFAPGIAVGWPASGTARASASNVAARTLKRTSSISEKWSRNAEKEATSSARGIGRLALPAAAGAAQPWSEIHLTWRVDSAGAEGNGGASTAWPKYVAIVARSRSRAATDRSRSSFASDSERSSIASSRSVSLAGGWGAWVSVGASMGAATSASTPKRDDITRIGSIGCPGSTPASMRPDRLTIRGGERPGRRERTNRSDRGRLKTGRKTGQNPAPDLGRTGSGPGRAGSGPGGRQ